MINCRICNNNKISDFFQVKEMMFGTNETFTYFLCRDCVCLQIVQFPSSMEKYYDNDYYSFKPNNSIAKKISTKMAIWRDKGEIYNQSLIGSMISKFIPSREEIKFISYLEGIDKDSKILDIGSGIGFHLKRLSALGFTNLRGIDPFLKEKKVQSQKVSIFKAYLGEYNESNFDLITLHHTFEHLPNPKETLGLIYSKLASKGYCAIRTPVIPNLAWELYRENWFQIDAPRHFFIHSPTSILYLCHQVGFKLEGIIYDSTPFQYYISEQYQQGIPLTKQEPMDKQKKDKYKRKTMIANKLGKGDQAIFILRKQG